MFFVDRDTTSPARYPARRETRSISVFREPNSSDEQKQLNNFVLFLFFLKANKKNLKKSYRGNFCWLFGARFDLGPPRLAYKAIEASF